MIGSCFRRSAIVCIFALASAHLCNAQRAQITGRITDSSGAVVADADVGATNVDTGLRWEAKAGRHRILHAASPAARPLSVARSEDRFKPISRSGITLELNQVARIDFMLEVGNLSESVTVTAEISRVQTEDSTLGAVVERQRIEQLPLNGRNVFNMVKLVGGVQPRFNDSNGFAQQDQQRFSQMRINGGPVYGNQAPSTAQ